MSKLLTERGSNSTKRSFNESLSKTNISDSKGIKKPFCKSAISFEVRVVQ